MALLSLPNSTASAASVGFGQGPAPSSPVDGDVWYDSTQKTQKLFLNGGTYVLNGTMSVVSTAPAALSSLTGVGTFSTIVLPSAFMNVAGKVLRVKMNGIYTTGGAQTPTIGIQVGFSGAFTQTVILATSQATTASQSNFPWEFEGLIFTVTTGVTGTLEGHGRLAILLGSSGSAPESVYQDANTSPGTGVNLTNAGANNLLLQANTSGALSSIQLRTALVEALN